MTQVEVQLVYWGYTEDLEVSMVILKVWVKNVNLVDNLCFNTSDLNESYG